MIHLKNSNSLTHSVFIKKKTPMRHILKFSKNFSQRATETLRSTVLGSHTLSCLLYNTSILHAFEVDILSLHTYVTNSIHSLGISKYQLTMYFLIFDFWFILMSSLCCASFRQEARDHCFINPLPADPFHYVQRVV